MKKLAFISAIAFLSVMYSCTINTLVLYDDGYYTASQRQAAIEAQRKSYQNSTNNQQTQSQEQYVNNESIATEEYYQDDYTSSQTYQTDEGTGNTYITNNYYFDEDSYEIHIYGYNSMPQKWQDECLKMLEIFERVHNETPNFSYKIIN